MALKSPQVKYTQQRTAVTSRVKGFDRPGYRSEVSFQPSIAY